MISLQATATKLEKGKIREDMLKDWLGNLKRKGIECEVVENTIQGKFKNEPFLIYIRWLHEASDRFVGVVTTRYKGKDDVGTPPMEVLR